MEDQQGRGRQQEVQLPVEEVELPVWAALAAGVGTEQRGRQVGAAWVAAWVIEPGVSQQVGL